MFKKSTISLIAIALTVAIFFTSTGIAQASVVSTQQSAPWTPLADSDMAKIEGGWIWPAIGIAVTIITACIGYYASYKYSQEPTGTQPFPEAHYCPGAGDKTIESEPKKQIIIQLNVCGNPNQVINYNVIQ